MGDIGEALERHGLGFLVPGSRPEQNLATQTNSGGWLDSLFHRKQAAPPPDPPPPPPPPKLPSPYDMLKPNGGEWRKTGLWDPGMAAAVDSSKFGNRTLTQIAGTLYNENKPLRAGNPQKGFGDQKQLDEGARVMAHAIINGSFKNKSLKEVATSEVSEKEKGTDLYKHYLEIARQALAEHMDNNDPVQGRTQYNHRFNSDVGNRIVKGAKGRSFRDPAQPVFQRYGPFENVAGQPAYIVIYGNVPGQQQSQPQGQSRPTRHPSNAQSSQNTRKP